MIGNHAERKFGRTRRLTGFARLALGLGVSLSGAFTFLAVGGGIQPAGAYERPGSPCVAGFVDVSPDSSTSIMVALPSPGCTAGDYRFSIWSTSSDVTGPTTTSTLIASTTSAPWVLPFVPSESPTCFFQVDFGEVHPHIGPNGALRQYRPLSALMGVIPGCNPT